MRVVYRDVVPWPAERPRCQSRASGRYLHDGRPIGVGPAIDRVYKQVRACTGAGSRWRTTELVVCVAGGPRNRDGSPSSKFRASGPEVVVTFDLDGGAVTLACDRYVEAGQNLAAIAATIEDLRRAERNQVLTLTEMLGAAALPGPAATRPWHDVLELAGDYWSLAWAEAAYRRLARERHPDHGGTDAQMAELNAAIAAARELLR